MLAEPIADLPPAQGKALRTLAFALDRFEAFPALLIPEATIQALVDAGFAESGRSHRPAIAAIGHRLTDRGWEAARRVWGRPSRRNWGTF